MISSRRIATRIQGLLVGRGASKPQILIAYGTAIATCTASAVGLVLSNDLAPWKIFVVSLIAFDVSGGAVACSMEPLQRAHRDRYASGTRRFAFSLSHLPHLLLLLSLQSESGWPTLLLGAITLVVGAFLSTMAPTSISRGLQSTAFLISAAVSFFLLSSSPLQGLLLMILFYKLFVAFPSFQSASLSMRSSLSTS